MIPLSSDDDEDSGNLSLAHIDLHDEESNSRPEPVLAFMSSSVQRGSNTSSMGVPSASSSSSSSASRRRSALESGSIEEDHPDESPAKRICPEEEGSSKVPDCSFRSSQGDEDFQCSICFDSWTNSGPHRVVCLKCGHCFGKSCLETWILEKKKDAVCPTCKLKCSKKDIRPIFVRSLKALDTHEREKLTNDLEKEVKKREDIEMELILANSRITVLEMELDKLRKNEENFKKELLRHQNMLAAASKSSSMSSKSNPIGINGLNQVRKDFSSCVKSFVSFRPLKSIQIDAELARCRVMASSKFLETIAVSLPSSHPLFKGSGVRRVSTRDFKVSNYIHIHEGQIKDMVFKPEDNLLLTASDDKTVRLTSLVRNSVESRLDVGLAAWSCCWHPTQRTTCFVGLRNGIIKEYDIRNSSRVVREFKTESDVPLISVQCVYPYNQNNNPSTSSGILCNTLRNAYYISLDAAGGQTSMKCLPIEGSLLPAHYDHESGVGIISQRPSERNNIPLTHHLLSFSTTGIIPFKETCIFSGGNSAVNLTRPKVFSNPDSFNSNALIFAGDEASGGMLCYDTESHKIEQVLKTPAPVMDIDVVLSESSRMRVAALNKKGISFYERGLH